jgi:hypothetical protein
LFIWLDPEVVAHDELIATKSGYLNFPFGFRCYFILMVEYRYTLKKLFYAREI